MRLTAAGPRGACLAAGLLMMRAAAFVPGGLHVAHERPRSANFEARQRLGTQFLPPRRQPRLHAVRGPERGRAPPYALIHRPPEAYRDEALEPRFFSVGAGDPLPEEWLDPRFVAWRDSGYRDMDAFLTEHDTDIYSFPLFSMEFCDKLVEEVHNIQRSGVWIDRPNSMNRYGVVLNTIGMRGLMSAIQRTINRTRVAQRKFGDVISSWDSHHSFVVQYAPDKDLGLDMHVDNSDVTSNINLGVDFEGSQIAFCGRMGAADHRKERYTYDQRKGHCLLHLGHQRHGAVDIRKGERMNLIIWSHSSTYRRTDAYVKEAYEREEGRPDEVCLSYTHDRDYGVFRDYSEGSRHFEGKGWCPPPGAEYEGFRPERSPLRRAPPELV